MRILVCGDRNWDNAPRMRAVLRHYWEIYAGFELIEGEARGADKLSRVLYESDWPEGKVHPFPANWAKFGKAAGPIRNQQQLDEGKPDLGLAFHNDIEHSKGTKDMVSRLEKAGIPVEVFTE